MQGLKNSRSSAAGGLAHRPGGEGGVVHKAGQLLGVTDGDQPGHGQLEAQRLILWRFVH